MEELQQKAGKEKLEIEAPSIEQGLIDEILSSHGQALIDAIATEGKLERYEAIDGVKAEVVVKYAPETGRGRRPARKAEVGAAFDSIEKDTIRKAIAVDKKRPDGRAQDEIRPIETEVDISPRVHGSALFTRGETQILSNVALGTTRMDMRIDTLGLVTTKRFWHHYNFPPFSVGEAGFMRGPKRRDIGHGALAERALAATIPDEEAFPYVIRVVSETLESNGSSSMGSVCASSMALQAAGVPVSCTGRRRRDGPDQRGRRLHRPHRHRRRRGPPRRHGLQGRRHRGGDHRPADGHQDHRRHLRHPAPTRWSRPTRAASSSSARWPNRSTAPREKLSPHAPAIESIKIDPEKIGAVIGKGGETIRGLCEEFEAEIDVEDDGTVRIYAPTGELVEACVARINSMTKEAEIGDRYTPPKSSRRRPSAPSSSWSRAPTACSTSPT